VLDLQAVQNKLITDCPCFTRVRLCTDFEGAKSLVAGNPPEAFLGGVREEYGENFALGYVSQKVLVDFSVWLVVRRTVDADGEGWHQDASACAASIKKSLVDCELSPAFSPITVVAAEAEEISKELFWWRIDFQTSYIECQAQ
jgi:hypothetical protein